MKLFSLLPIGLGKEERNKKDHEVYEYFLVTLKFILLLFALIFVTILINVAPETEITMNPEICINKICLLAKSFRINELYIFDYEKSFIDVNHLLILFMTCGILRFFMIVYTFFYQRKHDEPIQNGVDKIAPLADLKNV